MKTITSTNKKDWKTMLKDERYTVSLSFCGYGEPRYVVRFCDKWLGSYPYFDWALEGTQNHQFKRMNKL